VLAEQAAEAIAKARALAPADAEGMLIDATVALAMGKPDRAEAVLVRPDRHVFGTGDAETLRTAWKAASGLEPPAPIA
jgi:hypothetical protein